MMHMDEGDKDYHKLGEDHATHLAAHEQLQKSIEARELRQPADIPTRELPQPAGIPLREVGGRTNELVARQRKSVDIAIVCHEANRAYCISLGDHSQARWPAAPTWQQESAINGAQFHITNIEQGIETTPRQSHESWLAEKLADGWTWGPVKDSTLKTHPSCLPYDDLSDAERRKDVLFGAIVKALYAPLP